MGADTQTVLLAQARAGDEQAFAALIRGVDAGCRSLAYRLLGDRGEMDDVLQEAYVRAFVALPRFRGESSLRTWLYRVVYNACLDHLKRRRPRTSELPVEVDAETPDPADVVATRASLLRALAELAPVERAAVLLVDAEGLTYDDAARIVGVPAGTLASRLSRARAALRRSLRADAKGATG